MLSKMGKRIKALRIENGFTQSALGEKVGVTEAQIAAIENGRRNTKISTMILMSRTFGVSIDYIVGESEKK